MRKYRSSPDGSANGQVDPKRAFKIGPMDERYAAECGHRRNKTVRQERSSDAIRANRAKAHFYSARVTGGGIQAVDSVALSGSCSAALKP
jgi:hypothetical protein